MIKNKAIINEIKYREKQSYEVNYEEIYKYLPTNIHKAFYNTNYRNFLNYLLINFDIIPATNNYPSTLEVAFFLYIKKNDKQKNTKNLSDPDLKGFLTELENFDDVFYEVIYDYNKMYRTVGAGQYEFIITLDKAVSTEQMEAFILDEFVGYEFKIININNNVATIHVEVDGDDTMFADMEILLYHALDNGRIGTYTYEKIFKKANWKV